MVFDRAAKYSVTHRGRIAVMLSLFVVFVLILVTCNLPWILKDGLIKDDGAWYYWASEGNALWDSQRRAVIGKLTPYRDTLYSYGMTTIGLFHTRLIIVFAMSFASVCAFVIYRNLLGIRTAPAIVAALIPNLLPLVTEVPTSLNSSYAIWGMLPLLLSLIFYWVSTSNLSFRSYIWFVLSCLFFLIGMNLGTANVFLAPSMLVFALIFFKRRPKLTSLYCTFVIGYSAYHVHLMSKFSHSKPTQIPFEVVINRILRFFDASNILHFGSGQLAIALFCVGILALAVRPISASILNPERTTQQWQNLWIAIWILAWIFSTSVVYVAMAHQFEVSRHSYVFNYASVLGQVIGLFVIIHTLSRTKYVSERGGQLLVLFTVIFLIGNSGLERYRAGNVAYAHYGQDSAIIRSTLANLDLPENTQVLVLGVSPAHQGSILYNSGYVRYLTGRKDLESIMGKDNLYPHDPFAKGGGAWGFMKGLSFEYPLVAFRRKGNHLIKVDYLLRVTVEENGLDDTFLWELYDTKNSTAITAPEFSGNGIGEYYQVIEKLEEKENRKLDVAFSPGLYPEELLVERGGVRDNGTQNLITSPVEFGPGLNLHSVQVLTQGSENRLQMVLSIDGELLEKRFLPCYLINRKFHVINIAKFAAEGQHIRVISLPISSGALSKGIRLGFANRYHKLPLVPLTIVSKEHEGANHIVIKN